MTTFDDRARSAGNALRTWTPGVSAVPAPAVAGRAVRRKRLRRTAAGTMLVSAIVAIGFAWGPSHDDLKTGPRDGTTTTAATTTCTGQVGDSGPTYQVTLPDGWYTNTEAIPLEQPAIDDELGPCELFGPEPVTLSNAVVELHAPFPHLDDMSGFEENVAHEETIDSVTDSRRTTVDGHQAARFERNSEPYDQRHDGMPYVSWVIDPGTTWLVATGPNNPDAAPALDQIVTSLHFSD